MKNNDYNLKKRRLIIIASVIIVVSVLGVVLYQLLSPEEFKLVSAIPEKYSTITAEPKAIEFEFNHNLSKTALPSVFFSPFVDFNHEVKDNKFIIRPRAHFANNEDYDVVLTDIYDENNNKVDVVSTSFTLNDTSPRAQFIETLPFYGNGYIINYSSENSVFEIQITDLPEKKHRKKAKKYLNKNLDLKSEVIEFSLVRYLQGNGAPPPLTPGSQSADQYFEEEHRDY